MASKDSFDQEISAIDAVDEQDDLPLVPTNFKYIPLTNLLARNLVLQGLYGGTAGFLLYFSTHALRKPFNASKFEDDYGEKLEWFDSGISLKTAVVLFQLVGYMSSKWIGIKFVSEAKGKQDVWLVALIVIAELALVAFGLLENIPNWSPFAMFFNGLMLGLVWGLVVAYFEGKRISDFCLVCLSISFIVSSGIVQDVALVVLDWGINQFWMPSVVGVLFLPLYMLCVLMLNQLPAPSRDEVNEKASRIVMNHKSRLNYFVMFWPGLLCLWIGAMLLTAYREYRDTFAVEIFRDLGYGNEPGQLSKSESLVAGVILIPVAGLVFCKNNILAFQLSMGSLFMGAIFLILSVYTFLGEDYNGFSYYVFAGVASCLAYVPYQSVLYERLIAVLQEPCNISYLMAVMDALGYLGVFILFVFAEFAQFDKHLDVFNYIGQLFGFGTLAVYLLAYVYFFFFKRKIVYSSGGKAVAPIEEEEPEKFEMPDVGA